MLSLEPELESLRPILGDARTNALMARERREVFSVYPELRIAAWLGATLLATAAGILLTKNLERSGPLAMSVLMAAAAAACYAWTWLRRARASVVDDYILLLGALLVSADVAFVEAQFHLFDEAWKHHLFILAAVHAIGAYAYGSRTLLSLSIMAVAAWMGFDDDRSYRDLWIPALVTAAVLVVWREVDRRWRGDAFSRTFEHFAANIALAGAFTRLLDDEITGGLTLLAVAAAVIAWGFRTRSEPFVLYAFVYAVIAVDVMLIELFFDQGTAMLLSVGSIVVAIAVLIALHARFKELR